jgi:ribonuclease HII
MLYSNKDIVGTDEAGRGCLAGPVTAAAVVLPEDYRNEKINDSKKLSKGLRTTLRKEIEEVALCYGVCHIYPEEIDKLNILNASIKAMHGAINQLSKDPEFILVDGNRFHSYKNIPHQCVIKGDSKYLNIAAASILAKTYRDEYMLQLHGQYPHYGWDTNQGYPTQKHRSAIKKHGITPHHRKSFRQLPGQLQFEW